MRRFMWLAAFSALMLSVCAGQAQKGERPGVNWPSFRGPDARGIAEGYPTPTAWNAEKGENILWKTPIPGLGHSSPIVWGDRLFVTTAINEQKKAPLKVGLYGAGESADDNEVQQ